MRSILNTRPETAASGSPRAPERSSSTPASSASIPTPVAADPKNTGWTQPSPRLRRRAAAAGGPARARPRRRRTPGGSPRRARRGPPSARTDAPRRPPRTARRPRRVGRRRGRSPSARRRVTSRRAIASTTRSGSAPARSILLTKISVGTRSRWRARNRSGVCGWTPSTAETTSTAPSSTPRTRSTSAMKSGWPGVSTRLTARSPTRNEATADRIVMPRSRSSSSESVWVVPASTLPTRSIAPVVKRSRSVRVVLPASTWARIPRLSVRMGPHAFQGGGHLLAGHGCSHVAPFICLRGCAPSRVARRVKSAGGSAGWRHSRGGPASCLIVRRQGHRPWLARPCRLLEAHRPPLREEPGECAEDRPALRPTPAAGAPPDRGSASATTSPMRPSAARPSGRPAAPTVRSPRPVGMPIAW